MVGLGSGRGCGFEVFGLATVMTGWLLWPGWPCAGAPGWVPVPGCARPDEREYPGTIGVMAAG